MTPMTTGNRTMTGKYYFHLNSFVSHTRAYCGTLFCRNDNELPDDDSGGGGDDTELCSSPSVDTIFSTGNGNYYVFKGSNYWRLTNDAVAPGYPRKISRDWKGLPDNIDAAFTWTDNEKTYFFKGSKYWKFDNMEPVDGYPKNIG